MPDIPPFSDDISGLWGPPGETDSRTDPLGRVAPRRPRGAEPVDADRLKALEQQADDALARLLRTEEAGRAAGARLAAVEETLQDRIEAVSDGLRAWEAALLQRLTVADEQFRRRIDAVVERLTHSAGVDRVAALENQVRELARLVSAGDGGAPRSKLGRSVRSEVPETLTTELVTARDEETATAVAAALDAAMSHTNDQVDLLAGNLRADLARIPSVASALAPLRSDIHTLRTEVEALTADMGRLRARSASRTAPAGARSLAPGPGNGVAPIKVASKATTPRQRPRKPSKD